MFRFTYMYPPKDHVDRLEAKARKPNAPCQKQMLAWIECMKEARTGYVDEGNDVEEPTNWAYYHLKKCLHPFIDARECQVDKKVEVIRQMKKLMTEEQYEEVMKKMRYQAHKTQGVDKWDRLWDPNLDYTEYFKKYREHMENILKLEEEYKKESRTGEIADPEKYLEPLRYLRETSVNWVDDPKMGDPRMGRPKDR